MKPKATRRSQSHTRSWSVVSALLAGVVSLYTVGSTVRPTHSLAVNSSPTTNASQAQARTSGLNEAYGKLPLYFEGNAGQTDPQVCFLARGIGYTLFLTGQAEAVLVLRKPATQQPALAQ